MSRDQEVAEIYTNLTSPKPTKTATPVIPEPMTRLEQYDKQISIAKDIFIERNKIYKDTFVFLGVLGTTTTLLGDVYRLRNMIYLEEDHGRKYKEQIIDKILDVINQSVITLFMIEEDNWEGR